MVKTKQELKKEAKEKQKAAAAAAAAANGSRRKAQMLLDVEMLDPFDEPKGEPTKTTVDPAKSKVDPVKTLATTKVENEVSIVKEVTTPVNAGVLRVYMTQHRMLKFGVHIWHLLRKDIDEEMAIGKVQKRYPPDIQHWNLFFFTGKWIPSPASDNPKAGRFDEGYCLIGLATLDHVDIIKQAI